MSEYLSQNSSFDPDPNSCESPEFLSMLNPWPNLRIMGSNVFGDVLAGTTVAIVALPLALAFGVASGIGPAAGMWAAILGGICVGLFGGSRFGVSGPTGPKVVQLAALLEATRLANGKPDLDFLFGLVFLSGLICIALSICRVGRFIHYIPYSAISGFMCGIGVIIILLEIPPMLGFATPSSVLDAIRQIPFDIVNENPWALLVSVCTFGSILAWPKLSPVKWIPAPLVGLIVGTGLAYVLGLNNIHYVGAMPTGLPPIFVPNPAMFTARFGEMIGPASALAGLCVFDSLLTCVVADHMTGDRHDSDREIFGQGIANLGCGLLGGVTTATATMRTVANIKCGAKTGLASIVHGVVLLTLMLGLAPLAQHIPMACLAGILLKVGYDILDHRVLPLLHRMPRADAICFWLVLGLTISVDLLVAMGVGVAIAFIRAVYDLGHAYPQRVVSLNDLGDQWRGEDLESLSTEFKRRVLKVQLQGPLFFGSADQLNAIIDQLDECEYVIVRMRNVPMVDMSGAFLLSDMIEKAKMQGAAVILMGLPERVRQTLQQLRVLDEVGEENCVENFEQSLARVKSLDGLVCRNVHRESNALVDRATA
ncbi:MAG: SulP family inorganic anion transporter [Planctomycetota bacterium]